MYRRVSQISLAKHKMTNMLHSIVLLAGMVLLLSLLGWSFAGATGVRWALLIGMVGFVFSPQLSPHLILRWHSGRPLSISQAPDLYAALKQLARKAELPYLPTLYYLPVRPLNAFATGNRKDAAVAVTDGMLQALSPREITAVLAHEVSHLSNNDLWIKNMSDTLGRLTSWLAMAGQFLLILNIPLMAFSGRHIPWTGILVLVAAPWLMTLLQMALSRTREYEADVGAVSLTGDPQGLASALLKIEQSNTGWLARIGLPGNPRPHSWAWQTHPNTQRRVEKLMALYDKATVDHDFKRPDVSNPIGAHRYRISVSGSPRGRLRYRSMGFVPRF